MEHATHNRQWQIEPIEFIIAGRATPDKKVDEKIINKIASDTVKAQFEKTIRHLDVNKHLKVDIRIKPGSRALVDLFKRIKEGEIPLANDTSIGVGFYPFTKMEDIVYQTENFLNSTKT